MSSVFASLPLLLACALLLPVLFFVLRPLLAKKKQTSQKNPEAALQAVLEQELDNDRATGMISQKDYLQARQAPQLQRSVQTAHSGDRRGAFLAAGLAGLWLVLGSLYFSGGGSEMVPDPGTQMTLEEIVATVEQSLEKEPGNREGWLLLARSAMVLKNYELAFRAYEKVEKLATMTSPRIILEYTESIVLGDQKAHFAKAEALIHEHLLENDTSRESAMFLAGILSFRMENYLEAVNYWEPLLSTTGEDPDLHSFINEQIVLARRLDAESTQTASVLVNVSLEPELQGQVMPEDTVFVYAQAESGSRAPLAVVRMKAQALPFSVRLRKEDSVVPGVHLANGVRVQLRAHISRSGRAGVMPGDFLGSSEIIVVEPGVAVDITVKELVGRD